MAAAILSTCAVYVVAAASGDAPESTAGISGNGTRLFITLPVGIAPRAHLDTFTTLPVEKLILRWYQERTWLSSARSPSM